ncbi:MAG TPA: hypothetical protein ENG09_02415 [Candidatus Syntrophoarchaeum butanivorans]|uniref:Uncharacterized protein n=1 Tax=Candidatus Syntropharchaeum butanivorans TaxID=1839936 RepID=A0A1F2P4X1_9EURY|nr:MAG: hypothetical protein SBU_000881 [Candidatus Syntrophoarchaeum butanivorans]RJS71220.1 MAG: hypothetical protein CW694_05785 [Candidatus Syntrophoarchaeum sp. WYZ-LMO15]RKY68644.1 MAG: hypothetical protein DRQ24_11500 [Candidatus Latescibacterota bacterium]HDM36097.1 hypothetical protein [Candidatus Syntrophoarchaeum butanivorans]
MIRQGFYRLMITYYNGWAEFESIYGDIDLVVRYLKRALKYAEKLKGVASTEYDKQVAEANIRKNRLILSLFEDKISLSEFKAGMMELERYPLAFARGREDIGTAKEAIEGTIHRIEYTYDRYDVRYPVYDMHRCGDR